jgi:hypothetical protein
MAHSLVGVLPLVGTRSRANLLICTTSCAGAHADPATAPLLHWRHADAQARNTTRVFSRRFAYAAPGPPCCTRLRTFFAQPATTTAPVTPDLADLLLPCTPAKLRGPPLQSRSCPCHPPALLGVRRLPCQRPLPVLQRALHCCLLPLHCFLPPSCLHQPARLPGGPPASPARAQIARRQQAAHFPSHSAPACSSVQRLAAAYLAPRTLQDNHLQAG